MSISPPAGSAIDYLPEVDWENTELEIQLSGDILILFDSAFEGIDLPDKIKIEIPKGNYQLETCHYKPDAKTYLILHRFV